MRLHRYEVLLSNGGSVSLEADGYSRIGEPYFENLEFWRVTDGSGAQRGVAVFPAGEWFGIIDRGEVQPPPWLWYGYTRRTPDDEAPATIDEAAKTADQPCGVLRCRFNSRGICQRPRQRWADCYFHQPLDEQLADNITVTEG